MSKTTLRLPEGFTALDPFVDDWAIATSAARAARRDDTSAAEQEHFYNAARAFLDPALTLLDGKPLAKLGVPQRTERARCAGIHHHHQHNKELPELGICLY